MDTTELIGAVAATLTTLSFVPQAVLVIRSKRTGGISLLTYAMMVAGVALWLLYGLRLGAMPIIAANAVTLLLASTILFITARERFGRRGTLLARPPGEPLPVALDPDRT